MFFPLALALLLAACADPVDRQIDNLVAGGAKAEEARMELNLAKREAIEPLIAAFADRDHSPRARSRQTLVAGTDCPSADPSVACVAIRHRISKHIYA